MLQDEILLKVIKPARYIGNEINVVEKDINSVDIRFAFCFPDVYEVGMSHLGMQILYFFLNRREDTFCERVFSPWIDLEEIMRSDNIPLFALESQQPIANFDFIGFTLQYEMSYSNIIAMLELGKIPIYSNDRGEECPLVIAGGPCAYNPEPLANIIDIFYIGEGEVVLDNILDEYKAHKKNGGTKEEYLKKLLAYEGIYIPRFYDVTYNEDGTISSFAPNIPQAPSVINKVILSDIENIFYPEKQLVPLIETVHDRVTLEVFRGCTRGCRFCQAGFTYRPVREKSPKKLIDQAKTLIDASGHDEISLVSLSTGDYSEFPALAEGLLKEFENEKVNVSLPSLRVDGVSIDLMEKIQKERKSSLTFAPEAGTQRLRDVINKGIDEEEILSGCKLAFEHGWNRVKLYYMMGLPTETEEDIDGIVKLSEKIVQTYYSMEKEKKKRPVGVVVSTSCFVPKPFTPFQWEQQEDYLSFMEKQRYIKKTFTAKQIKYNYHDSKLSVMEGVVARGDRRICDVIVKAYKLGARFDGWSEHYKDEIWEEAFKQVEIDKDFYNSRKRSYDEILPWDFINIGVDKEFLISESKKATIGQVTPNCMEKCSNCGATKFKGGVCYKK